MSYGGGVPGLLGRLLGPRRAIRCPICGETDSTGMSRSMLLSHYLAKHKGYYDWLIRWTLEISIAYGILFVVLLFVLISLGRETGTVVVPFLAIGYILSGWIAYRSNTRRHESVLAVEWVEKHGLPLP